MLVHYDTDLDPVYMVKYLLQEETAEEYEGNGTDPLTVSLYQMDLDRTQFLLRSYLRIRLQKVLLHMLKFFTILYSLSCS